jgi:hypothetical protein
MFVNIDTKRPKSVSSGKPTATTKKTAKKR